MHRTELLEEIAGRYGVAAEYPWRRYPQYAVFRHAGNRKWFAVLMNPPGRKLGLATEDEVAILNVKIRAEENSLLRGMDAVLPAEHFTELLPLLRRTFSSFEPGERRQLGDKASEHAGDTPATTNPVAAAKPEHHAGHGLAALQTVAAWLNLDVGAVSEA